MQASKSYILCLTVLTSQPASENSVGMATKPRWLRSVVPWNSSLFFFCTILGRNSGMSGAKGRLGNSNRMNPRSNKRTLRRIPFDPPRTPSTYSRSRTKHTCRIQPDHPDEHFYGMNERLHAVSIPATHATADIGRCEYTM